MKKGVKQLGEVWYSWAVVPASDDIDEILEAAFSAGNFAPVGYSGPGQFFADSPFVRIVNSRALVTQRQGFDV